MSHRDEIHRALVAHAWGDMPADMMDGDDWMEVAEVVADVVSRPTVAAPPPLERPTIDEAELDAIEVAANRCARAPCPRDLTQRELDSANEMVMLSAAALVAEVRALRYQITLARAEFLRMVAERDDSLAHEARCRDLLAGERARADRLEAALRPAGGGA